MGSYYAGYDHDIQTVASRAKKAGIDEQTAMIECLRAPNGELARTLGVAGRIADPAPVYALSHATTRGAFDSDVREAGGIRAFEARARDCFEHEFEEWAKRQRIVAWLKSLGLTANGGGHA